MVSTQTRCDHLPAKPSRIQAAVELTLDLCAYHRRQLRHGGRVVELLEQPDPAK